jgi:hypothetical protein
VLAASPSSDHMHQKRTLMVCDHLIEQLQVHMKFYDRDFQAKSMKPTKGELTCGSAWAKFLPVDKRLPSKMDRNVRKQFNTMVFMVSLANCYDKIAKEMGWEKQQQQQQPPPPQEISPVSEKQKVKIFGSEVALSKEKADAAAAAANEDIEWLANQPELQQSKHFIKTSVVANQIDLQLGLDP